MTNLFKKLVFTDKAIDDLTVAVQAGKSITVERAVLSGWTPPDDDQVYTPYKNSSGALDVAAVKANINKYFDKTEALKNTAPAWVEGILKSKTVKQENKNTLNFALDFENTDFDHDVAAKYYGYTSWAELLDNMSEFNIDAQSVALLAQDDTGLEYVFAFAKIESDDSLKYPAALTTELTHKLHIDLFINITQSDNIIVKYIPEGLVEYSEFEQHVELANNTYAKKVDVYTKVESDNSFLTKTDAAATYTTKTENAKKANSSDVYTKTESDGRFVRSATVNGGETITPNSEGNLALTVPDPDLSNLATKEENAQKADKTSVYTKTETYNRTEIDDKAKGPVVINYDIDTKTPTQEVKQHNQKWLVDNNVLAGFADHINRLRGRNKLTNPNFNETKETGVYYVSNPTTENHAPCDNYGTLIVANGNNSRCAQMFIGDTAPARFFYRNQLDSGKWLDWQESARQSDLTNYYTKTESDGRFARSATINGGAKVTPNSEGNLALTVNVGVKKVNNTAPDVDGNVATIQIFDTNAKARDYSAEHPNVLTGVLL